MPKGGCKKPLSRFARGCRVKISDLGTSAKTRGYLCALGLTPGETVEIRGLSGCGCCRLFARGSEITLGGGLAEKIMACEETGEAKS